jgi:hypothetical protein
MSLDDFSSQLTLLQQGLSLVRPSHAKHAAQQLAASLACTRRSLYLDRLRMVDRPSRSPDHLDWSRTWQTIVQLPSDPRDTLLADWETFLDDTMSLQAEPWWRSVVPSVRAFALAALEQGLGLPRPTTQPADQPLPPPPTGALSATLLFTDLRDAALALLPPLMVLARACDGPALGLLCPSRRIFWTSSWSPDRPAEAVILAIGDDEFTLWLHGGRLAAVRGPLPLSPRGACPPPTSAFSPEGVLWPWWLKDVPPFHNTDLARRADIWRATFGPFLGQAALSILM